VITQSFADGRPARRDPRRGPGPDLAHHSPGPTSYVDGRSAKTHPGIQGPRSRPGQAQSRAQPTPAHYGTAGRADPPGHSRCLGTGPTTHSPRIPRGAHWAAGRRDIPGHSSCHGSGPAMPGPHITHGTAGRRERPSGDTGPATAYPSGTSSLTQGGQAGTNRQRRPAGPVAREAQHATPVLTLVWQVRSNRAGHASDPAVTARARDVRNAKAKAQSSGNMGHGYLQRER
jgi:hypothetical protein